MLRLHGLRGKRELAGSTVMEGASGRTGGGSGKSSVVTTTLDGRIVSVFVPTSQPPRGVVFAADGQLIAPWGQDLAACGAPPVVVVGVHRAPRDDVRMQEYSPVFNPAVFAAHEEFFVRRVPE